MEPMFEREVAGLTIRGVGGLAEIVWPSGRVQLLNPDELKEFGRQLEVSALTTMFNESTPNE